HVSLPRFITTRTAFARPAPGRPPRYPTSALVCGPPTPLRPRPGSGCPRVGLPLGTDAFLSRPSVRPYTPGASEGVEPGPPSPRLSQGPSGASQVTGLPVAHVPWSYTPPRETPPRPVTVTPPTAFRDTDPLGFPGWMTISGLRSPRPTCSPAYASTGALPLRL